MQAERHSIPPLPAARRKNERGIALVSVLLTLALLGVIAASFLRETKTATTIAYNLVENAKAETLADAGIERAMLGLLDADRATAWRADGRPYEFRLGGGAVQIRLQDEAGKVDVNRAPARVMQRLFLAAGLGDEAASGLVDGILAARRTQPTERSEGSDAAEESMEAPENLAFESLDDLMRLPAMRDDVRDRLAPYITVYSNSDRVDPAVAPPLLRQVLSEVSAQGGAAATDAPTGNAGAQTGPVAVTVLAEATTPGGGRFVREALLKRTDDPAQPFRILVWRQRWQ